LVEFEDNPRDATATGKVKSLLSRLISKDNLIITVISGRDINDLVRFLDSINIKKINLVGTHGMEIKYKDSDKIITNTSRDSLPSISELKSEIIKTLKDIPCFYLEDKKKTLAVHYRKCRGDDLAYLNKVIYLMENFIKDRPLDLLKMSNVIEIKPENTNKGRALRTIKKKYRNLKPSIDICIGDDVTDNYLFRENKKGINIKVGTENPGIMETEYFLKNVNDVLDFLHFISDKL